MLGGVGLQEGLEESIRDYEEFNGGDTWIRAPMIISTYLKFQDQLLRWVSDVVGKGSHETGNDADFLG